MNLLDQIWAYLERVIDRDGAKSLELIATMKKHESELPPADPLLPALREAIGNLDQIVANDRGEKAKHAA